jgi:hypothetical protein
MLRYRTPVSGGYSEGGVEWGRFQHQRLQLDELPTKRFHLF